MSRLIAPVNEPLTPAQIEEKFIKYKRMAMKIAANMSRRFDISYDELADESLSILGLALSNNWVCYLHAGECTWVYKHIYWPLLTYCTRARPTDIPFSVLDGDDGEPFDHPAKPNRICNLLRELGEDARIVVDTIIHAPTEIADDLDITSGCQRAKAAVARHLAETEGWFSFQIKAAFTEVGAAISCPA
jgi:hypothetical protein